MKTITKHRFVYLRKKIGLLSFFILLISCIDQPHTRFDHTSIDSLKANAINESFKQSYKGEDRHIWQKPGIVMSLLGDVRDQTIADIGAGAGYFSFKFVKDAKKIIAIDIDERMIMLMNEEIKYYPENLRNKFEARLAKSDDPLIAENEVDIIFVANTFAYIENRVQYFSNLLKSLKPQGRIMIIDFKMKHTPIGPDLSYRIPLGQAENEIIQAGYHILKSDDSSLDYQYILLAQKPSN